jgi:hypothetical protein
MSKHGAVITAESLSKSGAKGADVTNIVNELRIAIDAKLSQHKRSWGRNVVPYTLPTVFTQLHGLARGDAQRIIYATIIRMYQQRKFDVRIYLGQDEGTNQAKTILYIAWIADLTQKDIDGMNEVIREARIAQEDIDGFLSNTSIGDTLLTASQLAATAPPLAPTDSQLYPSQTAEQ